MLPQKPSASHPMLSLAVAARLAYRAVSSREAGEQTLNMVARMIASRISVFASADGDFHAHPGRIMPDEVLEGDFEGGGETLNFKDGRPPLRNVCMRRQDLDNAIAEIRRLYNRPAL